MTTKPNWTVLVYMAADTSDTFYRYGMQDIGEMMDARFGSAVKVVVHADAPSPWERRCWRIAGSEGGQQAAKLEPHPCKHVGLLDFITKYVEKDESDYYLVVLWGHGEGIDWREKVLTGQSPNPPIQDVNKRFAPGSQGAIEVGELGEALAGFELKNLNGEVDKSRVVVGFDACLMGMVEVYYEIREHAGWGVATSDEIPDTGWPYKEILNVLGDNPKTTPGELSKAIVDICANWYSANSPDTKISFASCDLSKSDALQAATTRLASDLSASIKDPTVWKAVSKARDFADDLQEVAYIDVNSFCSELQRQALREPLLKPLKYSLNGMIDALGTFVTQRAFSNNYPYKYSQDAYAVSICFPASAELVGSIPNLQINWGAYIDLNFSRTTYWPCFLAAFWDAQRALSDRRKSKVLAKAAGC
jgi:hypothetical protein